MPELICLHNHILPGLDDGARDRGEAVELVARLASLGFRHIHPTPHQKANAWAPTRSERNEAAESLRAELREAAIPVEIHEPAGENMWDELFLDRQDTHDFPHYEGHRAFLVEFPPDALPPSLPDRLFRFRLDGLLPVIAHVERYPQLMGDPALIERVATNAALTMNLSSLGGLGGFFARRAARGALKNGYIHALVSDAHSEADLRCSEQGLDWVRRYGGDALVSQLLDTAPTLILKGELPDR